ncbi:MAG: HPr kinase/phosphorylase [Acetobacteraceae bacterium]
MQLHATCLARDDEGLLLLGSAGAGKSDLALRLLDHGFLLVADDRVDIEAGRARAPAALAGLLEVRGLGIFRLPFRTEARLVLAAELGAAAERLPEPRRHHALGLPVIALDPFTPSAPARLALAFAAATGRASAVAGALAAQP